MTAELARRGPDSQGIHEWPRATLGHRRLSIYDLSDAGRQPMVSADGQTGIVFNGAVYNFPELRRELESHFAFRSQTDTEVLLHGYRHWGIRGLAERLRGMFAFAIWDNRELTLHLVRDRLGVKPLAYARLPDGGVAFASTVRSLRGAMPALALNPQAVLEFLEFGFVPDSEVIYRGMTKVPAASICTFRDGQVSSSRYWQLPDASEDPKGDFDDVVDRTEALLLEATRLRLFADVPVGALLSGGIDSALVCWAASQAGSDITAFTVGVPGNEVDETADAIATAKHLGIRHQVLPLSPSELPGFQEMVRAYGEPFACSSALGMLAVSRVVRAHAKCLLTGDGGDDVFLGYPEHRHLFVAQRVAQRLPAVAGRLWRQTRGAIPPIGGLRRAKRFVDYATGGLPAVAVARDGLPYYDAHRLLGDRLSGSRLARREAEWSSASASRVLQEFLHYDQETRFTGEYLTKVDGATMYHALEARSPFLDHVLWEFAAPLPFSLRLQGGTLKAVLRALAKRRLGHQVAAGKKRGFSVPVQRWLTADLSPILHEVLSDSILEAEGWLHTREMLVGMRPGPHGVPMQVWRVFMLEQWLRFERSSPVAAAA